MQITLDEGYQFGLGAFETIAVYDGQPIFLEEHLKRLTKTCSFFGFINETEEQKWKKMLDQKVQHFLQDEEWDGAWAWKVMVSQQNILFTKRPNPYTKERYEIGFSAEISPVRRNETSPLVSHKTLNYGDCILEKRQAVKHGVDERIFLNTKGAFSEGTTTNLFFVKDDMLYTPSLSCGLLPGILRSYLMQTQKVTETVIFPQQMSEFTECFVTNSLMGIMPVTRIGTHRFLERQTACKLQKQYEMLRHF